jgi:hypothetical protein
MGVGSAGATRMPLPHRLNFAETFVVTGYGRGRSSSRVRRRSGLLAGSTGGKRRPDPHGQRSLRPSFSTSSVSMPTTRSPRLTLDSLEGTPGGACWSAQKDASASRSRSMAVLLVWQRAPRIVAGTAVRCQPIFGRPLPWASISCTRYAAIEDVHLKRAMQNIRTWAPSVPIRWPGPRSRRVPSGGVSSPYEVRGGRCPYCRRRHGRGGVFHRRPVCGATALPPTRYCLARR